MQEIRERLEAWLMDASEMDADFQKLGTAEGAFCSRLVSGIVGRMTMSFQNQYGIELRPNRKPSAAAVPEEPAKARETVSPSFSAPKPKGRGKQAMSGA